jgi:hypothetical protein
MRYHFIFTPCIPFIIIGTVLFWRFVAEKIRNKGWENGGKIWATIPLLIALVQYPMYSDIAYQYHENLVFLNGEILEEIRPVNKNDLWALVLSSQNKNYSWENLDDDIKIKRPKYIFALDSLFFNYCKYKKINYQRQCEYFKRLLQGKENYKVVWKNSVNFPFKFLFSDPELSQTFYLFKIDT